MDNSAHTLISAVKTVSREPSGRVLLHDGRGQPVECQLDPAFPKAVAIARAHGGTAIVTLRAGGLRPRPATLRSLPDIDDHALVLERDVVDSALGSIIENLVNQIAHDVRNHVFSIGLQAELGGRRAAQAPDVRGHFDAVLRQIDSLKAYIEKLLLFGRPVTLARTATDLDAFIREQVQRYQFAWDQSGPPISVGYQISVNAGSVAIDQRLLAAAFRELLDNAARAISPPPPLTISIRRDDDVVCIEVADRGPGIPADQLERVLVPMLVRRAGGSGLGLAIARKMTEAHGGHLEIESSPAGTVVRMLLPQEVSAG